MFASGEVTHSRLRTPCWISRRSLEEHHGWNLCLLASKPAFWWPVSRSAACNRWGCDPWIIAMTSCSFYVKGIKTLFWMSSFTLTTVFTGRFRNFSYTPLFLHMDVFPYCEYHSQGLYVLSKHDPKLTHHNHPKSIGCLRASTLNVVHFIGLDKTVMTYNFGMLQSLGSQSWTQLGDWTTA